MGKNKFIDKKKSATFQLYARDTSDPNYSDAPGADRVFVRVDRNPYSVDSFSGENNDDDASNSVFDDAPEDVDEDEQGAGEYFTRRTNSKPALPDDMRKEILELGFPDDGYNYLLHLREIKNTGAGSLYFHNPKAKVEQVSLDVKAYDASRVPISNITENSDERSIYKAASHTVGVRLQKALDPEVAALLDDDDDNMSRFDSDIEDLEEDFILKANLNEDAEGVILERNLDVDEKSRTHKEEISKTTPSAPCSRFDDFVEANEVKSQFLKKVDEAYDEKPRTHRLLDEQFDFLESQEYGSDSDDYSVGSIIDENEALINKLGQVFKPRDVDDLNLDGIYKVPADTLHNNDMSKNTEILENAANVIRRCVEFGEKYEVEDCEDKNVIIYEGSSDESEAWDCETIITTYSNLENHPGKIEAPERARKKKLAETVAKALSERTQLITLGGKAKLPLDFLPHGKNVTAEKVKDVKIEHQKRKQHGQETKEEKKERKNAVKEEKREARRVKKDVKELYKSEAHRAQKVAATSGPSSIHLM